ncbi:MAG TPA: lanthionine synthetase C family protein [Streptosporangiaceae bacterium]|nr:lanthionine synthetase C family protein [Streptosporangiaceae bacterium]
MTSTDPTPAGSHQDLGRGAAGAALGRIAAARLTGLPPRATASWIRAMTAGPVTANASASLFHGAPAVAFVLHTGAHPAYAAMLASLDEHVNDLTALKLAAAYQRIDRGELTRPSEYDLISGLTGLGVYHLVRHGSAASGMTAAVLGYLVTLAEPVYWHGESLPGWWSGTGPASTPDPAWPTGHLNLGMAHGIAGCLALLSGAMRAGMQVEGHAKAVSELCATFDRYRQGSSACPWWPAMISLSEYKNGTANSGRQARPSWCYGTPGQARAQQLAGLALGDHERMRLAERALAGCVLDRRVTGLLTDASLCHGWAGLVQALWRAASDALDPWPLRAALRTARRGMEDQLAHIGSPASSGLLEGTSGIMLAQNDLPRAGSEPPAWDACLLLTL